MNIHDPEAALDPGAYGRSTSPRWTRKRCARQLIRRPADLFEQGCPRQRYLGSKRFSLEGVTAVITHVRLMKF